MSLNMLTLNELSWTAPNGKKVIDGLNLSAFAGEFVCIVGPSGGGKTSLLRMVAGLQAPSSGLIHFSDEQGTAAATCSFVFQQPVLLPWLSVRRNLEIPFSASEKPVPDERVTEILRVVGLDDSADLLPRQLSGGMQSRVAIARALVTQPSLLLMDEPFSSLDEINRERMNEELQRIWMTNPCTVLFVTHDLAEAAFLADRVVVLTNRPARIFEEIPVTFSRPRAAKLLDETAFETVLSRIRSSLRRAMKNYE